MMARSPPVGHISPRPIAMALLPPRPVSRHWVTGPGVFKSTDGSHPSGGRPGSGSVSLSPSVVASASATSVPSWLGTAGGPLSDSGLATPDSGLSVSSLSLVSS